MKLLGLLAPLFILGFFQDANSAASDVKTIYGPPIALGAGEVRAFVDRSTRDALLGIGIAFSEEALQNLPAGNRDLEVEMPEGLSDLPFTHIGLDWRPMGHAPWHVYGVPHFDIHFYLVSKDLRQAMTCKGDDEPLCEKKPEPEYIPPGYKPAGTHGLYQSGWHWYNSAAPEQHGEHFTSTIYYGFYAGTAAFIEPMVTRAFLLSRETQADSIPLPQKFATKGPFPTAYAIQYDPETKLHLVTLRKFVATP